MAVSLITRVRTYFCCFVECSEMPKLTVHGRWSDMLLNIMEDEMDTCFLWGVLKIIWSMRLQECLANLVGRLVLRKKLFVHIKSRKSTNFSRSEICNKFILKSPTIAAYVFSRSTLVEKLQPYEYGNPKIFVLEYCHSSREQTCTQGNLSITTALWDTYLPSGAHLCDQGPPRWAPEGRHC